VLFSWLTTAIRAALHSPRRQRSYRPRIDGLEERVVPAFDLQLYKGVSAGMVAPGTVVNYDVTVINDGDEAVNLAVVQDTLPSGLEFVAVSASRGSASFQSATNQVTWSVSALDAFGGMETLNLTVRVNGSGIISNTASVFAAGQPELNTNNSFASASFQVNDPTPPPPPAPPPPPPAAEPPPALVPGGSNPLYSGLLQGGKPGARRAPPRFRGRVLRPGFRGVPIKHTQFQFRDIVAL
jgi:uncharacterized repeat protein (TIGR01451 family)